MEPIDVAHTPKLGFGLMRLPKRGAGIDVDTTAAMVDAFLGAGFTYFDTAFVYPGSEKAMAKALVERHPRESYTVATKLFATAVPTAKMAKGELEKSLNRAKLSYVDFYLLHSLMDANYKKYERFGLWDFVAEKKREGLIRHIGFSFHGGPKLLDELLTEHPEVEFVQLQINYADWENPTVQSRANWEVARAHEKPVVIMEPVKGGRLADPPVSVKDLFHSVDAGASPASWALRFAASLDGVLTVLSGMSTPEQMADNLATFRDFRPLSAEERRVIGDAMTFLGFSEQIPCTACHYCTPSCPREIPIPEIFAVMNDLSTGLAKAEAKAAYEAAVEGRGRASDCIACGSCEAICPQHIEVIETLKRAVEELEA